MIICDKPKFVFVHVPKTGGVSIHKTLLSTFVCRDTCYGITHNTYPMLLMRYPELENYFSFVFVRNPWERFVSMFSAYYPTENPIGIRDKFTIRLLKHQFNTRWAPYTQVEFVKNVNFVGRYEHLEDDFFTISKCLNVDMKLPHLNKSVHPNYRDYYTDDTRQWVAEHFRSDIEAFGYEF